MIAAGLMWPRKDMCVRPKIKHLNGLLYADRALLKTSEETLRTILRRDSAERADHALRIVQQ